MDNDKTQPLLEQPKNLKHVDTEKKVINNVIPIGACSIQ